MATWTELQTRVRTEFTLDVDQPTEFALTIERNEGGVVRAQRVMARLFEAWGLEMVEIRSAFGEVGDYEAGSLLQDNLNLPLGCVALHGRYLVLVHKTCLQHISVEGALFLLTRVSVLADVLESRRGNDRF